MRSDADKVAVDWDTSALAHQSDAEATPVAREVLREEVKLQVWPASVHLQVLVDRSACV